ncbi:hypothetical protein BD780_000661 [Clostridium tetanomorphum]|uniref:Uncharacterized protein n=1 Tax=Clostridium tetanomorphum TaxID=1553 RepID=A0A923IYI7_CLOTT|nr:hypothetical protein [Clostridium tetanomorphum]MBC2396431.1 hypothetical protein [Clostridium tetanomorphum]MBP1863339.1 hypothetical protein [Clostridium tetanomorphum]NRS83436.1 hypothetical protein [Clostridium tetanomorphum]NRZ96636.1 hypothetical protein [Clostridium tetanomorphum]
MKILFCNIGWMKRYKGVTGDDNITLSGEYVDKNHKGAEQYNFLNIDGNYYGYVCTKSSGNKNSELQLEKIDDSGENKDSLEEVLVIWVAKRPNDKVGGRIIGWYKNATVYRFYKENSLLIYNIKAKVEDCVLIPPMHRTYIIYPARVIGAGKGMGKSNTWFAKGEEAEEIIENCIRYIETYSYERYDQPITEDQLTFVTKDEFNDLNSYLKEGDKLLYKNPLKSIQYWNKIIKEGGEDLNILYRKALGFINLRFYSKADKLLRYILTKDSNYKEGKKKIIELENMLRGLEN